MDYLEQWFLIRKGHGAMVFLGKNIFIIIKEFAHLRRVNSRIMDRQICFPAFVSVFLNYRAISLLRVLL